MMFNRKCLYDEVLWCTGGKTVADVNSKIADECKKYRESLKYVRSRYKCRVEGCPVNIVLVADKQRDVLEIKHCVVEHKHDRLAPDSGQEESVCEQTTENVHKGASLIEQTDGGDMDVHLNGMLLVLKPMH